LTASEEVDFRMAEGANERIQLEALIAHFILCGACKEMTLESALLDLFSFIPSKELIVVLIAALLWQKLRLSIPIALYAI